MNIHRRSIIGLLVMGFIVWYGCKDQPLDSTKTNQVNSLKPQHTEGTAPGNIQQNFRTNLNGTNEVPSVETNARGEATFKLSKDGTSLHYKLIVANIENVLMAHIHNAPTGVNGGIIVWLYPSSPPPQLIEGRSQGILAEGSITADDLLGTLQGKALDDLLKEMRAGNTYVNVHTTQNPGGEVRGQIH